MVNVINTSWLILMIDCFHLVGLNRQLDETAIVNRCNNDFPKIQEKLEINNSSSIDLSPYGSSIGWYQDSAEPIITLTHSGTLRNYVTIDSIIFIHIAYIMFS